MNTGKVLEQRLASSKTQSTPALLNSPWAAAESLEGDLECGGGVCFTMFCDALCRFCLRVHRLLLVMTLLFGFSLFTWLWLFMPPLMQCLPWPAQ